MNDALVRRLRVYLEPPACRVPLAAVSIAFENGDASETRIMTAAAERADASITVDSRFVVQSITKSFTAAVILRLVASGKLMLDIPLSEWLPDASNASRITIRQCLQHTSGLPDYGMLPEYHVCSIPRRVSATSASDGRRSLEYRKFLRGRADGVHDHPCAHP